MNRIKVLHVITHLGVGGALDNTLLTVERLPRGRYEVHLAAGPPEPGYTSWEERSRDCADALFLLPDLQRRVQGVRDYRACRRLTELIRNERYDVVHTHCAKAGVLARIAARRARTPVVLHTFHSFGSQVTRVPHRTLWGGLAKRAKEQIFIHAERYASRISDRVITVCEQNRHQAIQRRLAPADKVSMIYSGIDLDRFNVRSDRTEICEFLGFDPARPLIGFMGRLAEQKAPLDFVAAAHQVLEQRPDAQLVIAGDGPLADQVLAATRGEARIQCIGFYEEVPELLSVLDILAVSSLWEGLGRSVTEAMILGVPVAATAVDGIPELVKHNQTGLLSPPRDPAALARNIVCLLDSPGEARVMAALARDRVALDFDADGMVLSIDALYQQLLSEKEVAADASTHWLAEETQPA